MTHAKYKVGDIVTTIYDYSLNSGIVTKVQQYGDGVTDPIVFDYIVAMDSVEFGDSKDYQNRSGFEIANLTSFNEDEISWHGKSQEELDEQVCDLSLI